ncbi:GNAT family N-acetyltransferase [Geothrix sp. 21YS21S-2]|uniref:GNAT family N-acetyltransferase n=1 Tax=Geothrix sp. 21YS21S-2 TaxID=3068893 RepID=UPI0027B8C09D|nr:GNAT family N-acetyltransferase [Geothrix sp. 21YS21S-2]
MTRTIRPALATDAEAIAAIGRRSFVWAFGHLYPRKEVLDRYLDATYSVAKIAASLAKPANVYFVAEGDRIEGFLKLKAESPDRWQTQKLYIDPDLIQGGAGKQLMAAGEEAMLRRGVASSWLVVYEGNGRALRFYAGLGYAPAGTRTLDFEGTLIRFLEMEKTFLAP